MEEYATDGALVLFPKALLSSDVGQTVFKNNSQHIPNAWTTQGRQEGERIFHNG